jgi:hypothetical protein
LLMFNVCVNAVVGEWLHQTLGADAARQGVGDDVATWLVAFYINDGLVASRDPVWLSHTMSNQTEYGVADVYLTKRSCLLLFLVL